MYIQQRFGGDTGVAGAMTGICVNCKHAENKMLCGCTIVGKEEATGDIQ
jgi:hypothetical protein